MRPSELLFIEDPYRAYCLNQAVGFFGTSVEADLEAAEGRVRSRKGKTRESAVKRARLQVLERYGIVEGKRQQFADPALMK